MSKPTSSNNTQKSMMKKPLCCDMDTFLFTGTGNGQINQFCVKHKKLCKKYADSHNGSVETLCVTSDKKYMFTGGVDKRL